ncbi:MAG: UDP-3-O-(3-hydroxymyristoyl)glucosamine N-acyltransferase [Kiritimatiellae bacterium]|nr:UDP-3-O-(3-hydroxymyristoyl)glucosamine N-acyltransferase [Kiritimatiellia bacterium]
MTVSELAALVGGRIEGGAPGAAVRGVASLHDAVEGDVSFLANPKYATQVAQTKATAVFVAEDAAVSPPEAGGALVRVPSPDGAFAKAVPLFTVPPPVREPGIHASAVVDPAAKIGRGVHIGPLCWVGPNAEIGDGTVLEAHVVIADGASIGENCHIYPMVSVRERCRIGARVIIHNGSVIGADGFGYETHVGPEGIKVEKIPQLGIVEIGDDVEIGANTTIDRARFGATVIGHHTKIDNLVQIGHNVRTGPYCGIVSQVGIAGSTHLGTGVMIWGQAGLAGHLTIGDGVEILAHAGVAGDLTKPGQYLGAPAVPKREALRVFHAPRAVERLKEQVAALEAKVRALEASPQPPVQEA